MRLIIYLSALLFALSLKAQDYNYDWNTVIQNELDGKTESANKKVLDIYAKAKKDKNESQIIKCFFYIAKFRQVFDEKAQENNISALQNEINEVSIESKAILNFIYGSFFNEYYIYNSYKIDARTKVEKNTPNDFKTWTTIDFNKEIESSFSKVLENEKILRDTPLNKYKAILEISSYADIKQYTLYDFLSKEIINHYKKKLTDWNTRKLLPKDSKTIFSFYNDSELFINLDLSELTTDLQSLLKLLQKNENHYLINNKNLIDFVKYERFKTLNEIFENPLIYSNKIHQLEKTTTNNNLKQQLKTNRAVLLFEKSSKNVNLSNNILALSILDSVINSKADDYIIADAEIEKQKTLNKELSINLKRTVYQNENTRAYIDFRNIDSLKFNYYKITTDELIQLENINGNKHDFVHLFIKNRICNKTTTKSLPNPKNYFGYNTEVLLDKMDIGNYLLVVEEHNPEGNITLSSDFSIFTVTNIDYITDKDQKFDYYYLLDRKTGIPLRNAIVKTKNETVKTNRLGKAKLIKTKNDKPTSTDIFLIQKNDTLVSSYIRGKIYPKSKSDENISFEAKAMLYFDRAIYRPGQKVFFKGIVFQSKNNFKSIVPKLTIHLNIEDAAGETLKEYDIQTNEFGSFSGEVDLPKNVMTGEFNITIDEPDDDEVLKRDKLYYNSLNDEHSFWENVDFNYSDFNFKVEEYKRPTFEVTFDKIKEAYTIGDIIKITGNAKSLAGNNLTNATVKYSVNKYMYGYNTGSKHTNNFIQKEIKTDKNGQFIIEFPATDSEIKNEEIEQFSYTITTDVIDTNGETRSVETSVYVNQKTLVLNTNIPHIIYKENKNSLSIKTTNFNKHPIDAEGKTTIYKQDKRFFLKPREFLIPELQTLSKEEFERLFPYEPYDEKSEFNGKTVLKTLTFSTKNNNDVDLGDLETGYYQIETSCKDSKNNTIESSNWFEVKSIQNPLSNSEVFTFKRINAVMNSKNIEFEFQTILPKLFITVRQYIGKELISEKLIELINGKANFSTKKSNKEVNYTFHFSSQWENDYYFKTVEIRKEEIQNKVLFEVVSLRNKIEPNSKETWSFKITNHKLETEVLASMYDVSLDQFARDKWNGYTFYNSTYVDFPEHNNYNRLTLNFNASSKKLYYKKINIEPKINWFGFNFTNANNVYANKKYTEKIVQTQQIPEGATMITGVVSDANGPLPGVNVVVKSTQRGVQTDFDGSYTIYAREGEVLVFSFMGMKEVSKVVGASNIINTILQDESKHLSEVVVTALGIKKEEGIFNPNIIIVSNTDLNSNLFNEYKETISNLLSGKISGVQVTNSSGSPGASSRIVLRGVSSLTGSNNPLFIIDGVPYDALNGDPVNQLNPDDILSLTVLKDNEATALYGIKGKNGVIVINTRNGLKELSQVKTRTNFNETAFFYPHLTTDSSGKITFNFINPESLTRWKLRLFGHNKKGETGNFETEVISQKDIMVMPNMPRFLREKDTISLTSKVVNMTTETKSGVAVLQLYDAVTGTPIDVLCLNNNKSKNFICKPKESVAINWMITVPEGIQGIQYKVIAKSGNFSDGEENFLPVLTNKILVTESVPIWVRENTKKEFTFDNLKNNDSKTLKNHLFTFEYTSNPAWFALQSLPYLMEYEHECAEQTFARYYANFIATQIVNSNPKIAALFESWKKDDKKSKLEMNEELKSVVLNETPWLLDGNESEKNKRLAYLFDLKKLKDSSEEISKKLLKKQVTSGGFPWFDGGAENSFITQHILSGIGHLNQLFPNSQTEFIAIVNKGIPYIDNQFVNSLNNKKIGASLNAVDLQYLYTRSFYTKSHPLTEINKILINKQLTDLKINWLKYNLYQKAQLALVFNRYGEKEWADKIIIHLKETASHATEKGMYWLRNKNSFYWHESAIETQALLIEAFSEIENNKETVDALKIWLIKNKQTNSWSTTKATTEAIYALLMNGSNWLEAKDNTVFKIGNEEVLQQKLIEKEKEVGTGYVKLNWKAEEISKEMATITVENKSEVPGFGGVYWQYFENIENIKSDTQSGLSIIKEVFKKVKDTSGEKLIDIKKDKIVLGDIITFRLIIKTDNDLEFVHLKDLRASCFEPVNVISEYKYKEDLNYYMSTKDIATHFFFDTIKKGTYILEYDVRVNNQGSFNNGIATLQSMYAPEFTTHSTSEKIKVIE